MKKAILLSLFVTNLVLVYFATPALAETCGDGQYGTIICPPTDVTIDKTVRNPITGVFVENLLSGDTAYSPGSEVTYMLLIRNSSNQFFDEVKIEDILPKKIDSASISETSQNMVKNIVTTPETTNDGIKIAFKLANRFEPNTEVKIYIKAKVKNTSAFTNSKALYCGSSEDLQNNANVWAADRFDQDSSAICVATNVLGVTTLPKAGVTDILPFLPFIGTGLTGIGLMLKKGKKS